MGGMSATDVVICCAFGFLLLVMLYYTWQMVKAMDLMDPPEIDWEAIRELDHRSFDATMVSRLLGVDVTEAQSIIDEAVSRNQFAPNGDGTFRLASTHTSDEK